MTRAKSARQLARIDGARVYLTKHCDPIMNDMIMRLLVSQPTKGDVLPVMLACARSMLAEEPAPASAAAAAGRVACRRDRTYMAREISPHLNTLMSALVRKQPEAPLGFLADTLEEMVAASAADGAAASAPSPSRAKSKLDAARELDAATPLVVAPAAPKPPAKKRSLCVLMLGLDGGGKTTYIQALRGKLEPNVRPTTGFTPFNQALDESTSLRLYDVGGTIKLRANWDSVLHDCHGAVFVVDAAARDRLAEAAAALQAIVDGAHAKVFVGKPLLVVCNKLDVDGAASTAEVQAAFAAPAAAFPTAHYLGAVADPPHNGGTCDPRLEEGLEWLLEAVKGDWDALDGRVKADTADFDAQVLEKKAEKERNAFRTGLRKAFPAARAEGEAYTEKESEVFTVAEGTAFLHGELLLDEGEDLSAEASKLLARCGYQKICMMILGKLANPIKKAAKKWTWPELAEYVDQRRVECGLAADAAMLVLTAPAEDVSAIVLPPADGVPVPVMGEKFDAEVVVDGGAAPAAAGVVEAAAAEV